MDVLRWCGGWVQSRGPAEGQLRGGGSLSEVSRGVARERRGVLSEGRLEYSAQASAHGSELDEMMVPQTMVFRRKSSSIGPSRSGRSDWRPFASNSPQSHR